VAAQLRKPPVNVPRLLLHPHGMAPRIANLDQWAWHVIDALRQETMRNPPDHLGFAVPLRLPQIRRTPAAATLTHSGTAVDVTVAELRLEALLPADRATASILTKLGQAPPQRG